MKSRAQKFHRTTTYLVLLLSFSFQSFSTTHKDCGENRYSSEIISITQEGSCYWYELEVSFADRCSFELSHFTMDFGCGTFHDASNSKGWPMELNQTDPTTGLTGLKVDNIRNFGKDRKFRSFRVKFRFCPDDECTANCLEPTVAYKAGRCVYYEKLDVDCAKPLHVSAFPVHPTCHDENDGSIDLNISGGQPPYSVAWSDGQTDSLITGLFKGEYHFTVTDSRGEVVDSTISLTAPQAIEIKGTISPAACTEVATGSITLQLSGGSGSYSFLWSNGSTEKDQNGLEAGEYSVTVTDEAGCSATGTYQITHQSPISVTPFIVQPTCGDNDLGSIELEVSGGTAPYSFLWSDGNETKDRFDLPDGFYDVTVTDALGCEVTKYYSIRTQSSLSASSSITHSNCFNEAIAGIDLYVTGGTKPYSFQWSNGATTEDLHDIVAGKYSVVITDSVGCQISYNANVYPQNLQVYAWITQNPSCPQSQDAQIDGMVFFGTEPYVFEWSNGASSEDLTDVSAGTYTLTVTDAIGCTGSATVTITDPNSIQTSYQVVPSGCFENVSYDIDLNVSGGAGNYSFEWSNGDTTQNVRGVGEGTYSVTITDENGCSVSQEIIADGDPGALHCSINEPDSVPACGSSGNILTSSMENVVSYHWSVISSDPAWTITSSSDGAQIEFTSGGENSSATFTLEVVLASGCTASCSYTVTACIPESDEDENPDDPDEGNDGGENPDDGEDNPDDGSNDDDDDGDGSDGSNGDDDNDNDDDEGDDNDAPGDKDCDECFFTSPVEITKKDGLFTYTIEVNHDGDCRYDLSHLTISLPECAIVKDYSNSMNWPMEKVNNDPTTGLSGIKVDNIPSFGKDNNFTTFEIYMVLKPSDYDCKGELMCFTPEVAYKAATCVSYEQTEGDCAQWGDDREEDDDDVFAYPNPTCDRVKIRFASKRHQDYYNVDLTDFHGKRISSVRVDGKKRECTFDLSRYKSDMFFVKVAGSDGWQKWIRVMKQ